MAPPDDILSMSEVDLLARKNSITKDRLLDAVLFLKRKQESKDDSRLINEFSNLLDSKLDPIITEFKSFKDRLGKVEERLMRLETETHDKVMHDVGSEEQMMRVVDEVHQISMRKDNIVIFGLTEKETGSVSERVFHDEKEVRLVAASLDIPDFPVTKVIRLGHSQAVKPRPLRVTCLNPEAKQNLLLNSSRLRLHAQYKQVFINHDFTKMQQDWNRRLRSELKSRRANNEDVVIRKGRVVPRDSSRNQFF